jgi:hypothetical protein
MEKSITTQNPGNKRKPINCSIFEEKLILHDAEGDKVLSLPYQLNPSFFMKPELAKHSIPQIEAMGVKLDGVDVNLLVPREWGVFRLDLPFGGFSSQKQPLDQLLWEIGNNAPEDPKYYLFDYTETKDTTSIIAIRESVCSFMADMIEALGGELKTIATSSAGNPESVSLSLEKAKTIKQQLGNMQKEPPGRSFGLKVPLAVAIVAIFAIVLTLYFPSNQTDNINLTTALTGENSDTITVQEAFGSVSDSLAFEAVGHEFSLSDSASVLQTTEQGNFEKAEDAVVVIEKDIPAENLSLPTEDATPDLISTNNVSRGWMELMQAFAAADDKLPDFMVIDPQGILVRDPTGSAGRFESILGSSLASTRVGESCYWLDFRDNLIVDYPLPAIAGKGRTLVVKDLSELVDELNRPARIILQRIKQLDDGQTTRWLYGIQANGDSGWRVKIMPQI